MIRECFNYDHMSQTIHEGDGLTREVTTCYHLVDDGESQSKNVQSETKTRWLDALGEASDLIESLIGRPLPLGFTKENVDYLLKNLMALSGKLSTLFKLSKLIDGFHHYDNTEKARHVAHFKIVNGVLGNVYHLIRDADKSKDIYLDIQKCNIKLLIAFNLIEEIGDFYVE